METVYYDEELNPLEEPDLDWCNIEERYDEDGNLKLVCIPYTEGERKQREAALAAMKSSVRLEDIEAAIVDLGEAVAALTENLKGAE